MSSIDRLLLTGGGTAGHVIPHIALIEYMRATSPETVVCYVGSEEGIEKKLITDCGVDYYAIKTGKWRRYLTWRNLLVPYQVVCGVLQAFSILYRFKPRIVLSKGGFVALPVVIAAFLLRIPVVIHESDVVIGLTNRLSAPIATSICYSLAVPPGKYYQSKSFLTGLPVRQKLMQGDRERGIELLGFHDKKPIVFVWGGSLGALKINQVLSSLLPQLLEKFQIVHLCGPKKWPIYHPTTENYRVFDYLDTVPLAHILACADIVISRAGATAIYELLVLRKPHILCPLSTQVSRGEQIENARYCQKWNVSHVIYPDLLNEKVLFKAIQALYLHLPEWQARIDAFNLQSGTRNIYDILCKLSVNNSRKVLRSE